MQLRDNPDLAKLDEQLDALLYVIQDSRAWAIATLVAEHKTAAWWAAYTDAKRAQDEHWNT